MKFWQTVLFVLCPLFLLGKTASAQAAKPTATAPPPQQDTARSVSHLPLVNWDGVRKINESINLSKQGDSLAQKGSWKEAMLWYQQALDLWKDSPYGLYGMAKCCRATGDLAGAIKYYHAAIYSNDPNRTSDGYLEGHVDKLMEFVLLLNQAGQIDEALAVYQHAAHALNYQDSENHNGKPYLKVLLPEFGNGPNQVAYTPQRLAAMANVAIGYENFSFGENDMPTHLREAVRLYPDSPVAQFYLAENLDGKGGHLREARDAYRAAAQLGGPEVKAEVEKVMKRGTVDYYAKYEQDVEDAQKAKAAPK